MSEFIARLLPHTCRPIRLGGSHGLSGQDISHACVSTSRIGYLLIQAKYGDDNSVLPELYSLFYERMAEEAVKEHWNMSTFASLVNLSVFEYVKIKIYTDKKRAGFLGVHPSTWLRSYKKHYTRLFEILDSYEQSTLYSVKNRLK